MLGDLAARKKQGNPSIYREFWKADEGTRTPDLLITSELLYQLSYVGATAGSLEGASGPDKRRIRPTNHPYWTRRLRTLHPRIRYCRWTGHDYPITYVSTTFATVARHYSWPMQSIPRSSRRFSGTPVRR